MNLRRTMLAALIGAIIITAGTEIASGETITLDATAAESMAAQKNTAVLQKTLSVRTAQRSVATEWNVFLPSVSASVGGSSSLDPGTVSSNSSRLSAGVSVGLSLSASSVSANRETSLSYQSAALSLEDAQAQAKRDAGKDFYNALLLKGEIALAQNSLDAAQAKYDQAQLSYQKGLISQLDLLTAQSSLESLKPDLLDAQAAYSAAVLALKQEIGIDAGTDVELTGDIAAPTVALDAATLLQSAVTRNLSVRAAELALEAAQAQRDAATAGGLSPTLSVSYGLSAGTSSPFTSNWLQSAAPVSTVSASVDVPLSAWLPGTKTQVAIAGAADAVAEAQLTLDQARAAAGTSVTSLVASLENGTAAIAARETSVDLAQKTYDAAKAQYDAGLIPLTTLDDDATSLLDAQSSLFGEKFAYLSNLLDLEYATQTPLADA